MVGNKKIEKFKSSLVDTGFERIFIALKEK